MRVKNFSLSILSAAGVLALIVFAGTMCQKQKSTQSEASGAAVAEKAPLLDTSIKSDFVATPDTSFNKTGTAAEYYTCSMHPQVHQANPGTCPICGMTLVFHKADKTAK